MTLKTQLFTGACNEQQLLAWVNIHVSASQPCKAWTQRPQLWSIQWTPMSHANTQDGVSQHGAQWTWKRISSHLPSFLFCTRACCEQKYFPEWLHSLPLVNLVCNDWWPPHTPPHLTPHPSNHPFNPAFPDHPHPPANMWYQRLFGFTCNKSVVNLFESGEQHCIKVIDYSYPPFSLGKLMLTRSSSSSRLTMPWWPFRHATDSGVVCGEKTKDTNLWNYLVVCKKKNTHTQKWH